MPSRSDRHPEAKPPIRGALSTRDVERNSMIRHTIDRVLQDLERRFTESSDPA